MVFFAPPPVHRSSVTQTNTFSIRSQGNIPGWVATVITQAVLLFGCCTLHFVRRPSSADPQWGSAHSIIFGSGGEMRLRVDPPSFLSFTKFFFLIWLKIFTMSSPKKIFGPQKKILSLFFLLLFFSSPPPLRWPHWSLLITLLSLLLTHTFSAFWLRSSVVSVLISVKTDIRPIGLGCFSHQFFAGTWKVWACSDPSSKSP